jgi:hypothetical protein
MLYTNKKEIHMFMQILSFSSFRVSDWLSINAILQLYHDKDKFTFDETMMMSTLY